MNKTDQKWAMNMASPGNAPGRFFPGFTFVLHSGPWESRLRCNHRVMADGGMHCARCGLYVGIAGQAGGPTRGGDG